MVNDEIHQFRHQVKGVHLSPLQATGIFHFMNLCSYLVFFAATMSYFWDERFLSARTKKFCDSESMDCGFALAFIGFMATIVFCWVVMLNIYFLMGVVICLKPNKERIVDISAKSKPAMILIRHDTV